MIKPISKLSEALVKTAKNNSVPPNVPYPASLLRYIKPAADQASKKVTNTMATFPMLPASKGIKLNVVV